MMKWSWLGVAGAVLALSFALLGQRGAAQPDRAAGARTASSSRDAAAATEERSRPIEAPEPELARAVLTQVLVEKALTPQPAAPAPDGDEALSQVRATLDRRLKSSPGDAGEAARLRRTVQALLDSGALGETAAEVECSASLCRVDLIGDGSARVTDAAQALVERTPKTFSNVTVYPHGANQRAVYLAVKPDALKLAPEPDASSIVVKHEAPPR